MTANIKNAARARKLLMRTSDDSRTLVGACVTRVLLVSPWLAPGAPVASRCACPVSARSPSSSRVSFGTPGARCVCCGPSWCWRCWSPSRVRAAGRLMSLGVTLTSFARHSALRARIAGPSAVLSGAAARSFRLLVHLHLPYGCVPPTRLHRRLGLERPLIAPAAGTTRAAPHLVARIATRTGCRADLVMHAREMLQHASRTSPSRPSAEPPSPLRAQCPFPSTASTCTWRTTVSPTFSATSSVCCGWCPFTASTPGWCAWLGGTRCGTLT